MPRSRSIALLVAAGLALAAQASGAAGPARARGMGEIVMAVCLSAFESEMAQAGKRAPAGMANYACSCVVGQINGGQSIDAARDNCRSAAARRYPI
ncbi:MAG: hypothetical protein ACK55X_10930 [Synechococcaceae cyanobacterium]|jgi:hypothetical protein